MKQKYVFYSILVDPAIFLHPFEMRLGQVFEAAAKRQLIQITLDRVSATTLRVAIVKTGSNAGRFTALRGFPITGSVVARRPSRMALRGSRRLLRGRLARPNADDSVAIKARLPTSVIRNDASRPSGKVEATPERIEHRLVRPCWLIRCHLGLGGGKV